jgi:4-amino-4-deoxy-L-arabinose transferase-like glycosyltransferase
MWQVMKNPPLASHYLALAGAVLGWSEVAMHVAMLLPALGVVGGTWVLARSMSRRPGLAALAAAFSPVFLVSSTTVMSDVVMLCAWVWALVAWREGLERGRPALLGAGAGLAAVAALSKYFGIALLPLLLAWSLVRRRSVRAWAPWLLLPVAILAVYQWMTSDLYGRGLLGDAATYASVVRERRSWALVPKLLTGLVFAGGACLPAAVAAWVVSRRRLGAGLAAVAAALTVLAAAWRWGGFEALGPEGLRWSVALQGTVLAAAGLGAAILAVRHGLLSRDADGVMLFLWAAGTFGFAAALNWSVSARAVLPMVPAVAVLAARSLDACERAGLPARGRRAAWSIAPVAALALLVAFADLRFAETGRDAAVAEARLHPGGGRLWFEGHWGFQWYAEGLGMQPVDFRRSVLLPGDVVVIPVRGSNVMPLWPEGVLEVRVDRWPQMGGLATMSHAAGAGFYSDAWGPLPFAFGEVPPEEYQVEAILAPIGP